MRGSDMTGAKRTGSRQKQAALEPTVTERRRVTRNSIYQFIMKSREPVSKQEIASVLGLSLPTIHQNIAELLKAGLIRTGEPKRSTGGRPPIGYEINPDARFSMAAAISSNHFRIWAGNMRQEELAFKSIPVPNVLSDEISGEQLRGEINRFILENNLDRDKLLGIGVTIPGVFDEANDQIVLSPTLKMKNFSMKYLTEGSGIPIQVMNDSSSAGVEELLERKQNGDSQDFVCLFLENGIGGAIFRNGMAFRGRNGRSGEFGHTRIVPGGKLCNCGQRGCLEAYCSAYRFTRDLGLTADEFFRQVEEEHGHGPRTDILEDWLHYLALGIINIRMAFDCDIVLGGFVTEYLQPYMDHLKEEVAELDPFGSTADYLKITGSPKASLQGAAWIFIEKFINEI